MTEVYLSLGSNIQPRLETLNSALDALKSLPKTFFKSTSSVYETQAVTLMPQAFYLNSAVCLKTRLTPVALLGHCRLIEQSHGRPSIRKKNESRTLDIDIIFFGNTILNSKELQLPHPLYSQRRFVLVPLVEISPQLICSDSGISVSKTLDYCMDTSDVTITVEELV